MKIYKISSVTIRLPNLTNKTFTSLQDVSAYMNNMIHNKFGELASTYFLFEIDGFDTDKKFGIMNLYFFDTPKDKIGDLESFVDSELTHAGIKYTKHPMLEQSGAHKSYVKRYTISDIGYDASKDFNKQELNISDISAKRIFKNILGYQIENVYEIQSIKIPEILSRIKSLKSDSKRFERVVSEQTHTGLYGENVQLPEGLGDMFGGVNTIEPQKDFSYYERILNKIEEIANWGWAHGFEELVLN